VALAAGAAQAQQYLINELSFGHAGRLNSPENRGLVPNFVIQGEPRPPQVLSNKIILTPPSPGNQRASIWAEKTLEQDEWVTDIEFRATGPERGGGNLNLWLAKDGASQVGASSVYTVGKFEGLVLVVDAHGGSGGMLRGFLNDGTVDYASRQSVDELAFGHCIYPYRNLGRPSQIKLRHTRNTFKVEIDSRVCFESDKVTLPRGYNLGVTAATPENPDSFEVFKLVVMSDSSSNANPGKFREPQRQPPTPMGGIRPDTSLEGFDADAFEQPMDEDAEIFQTSQKQFQDLHNRLQSSSHQLSSIYRSVSRHHQLDEQRHTEVKNLIQDLRADLAKIDQIEGLQNRINDLEKEVRGMRNDMGRKLTANERTVKGYLSDHHATLSQTVIDSMPGHKRLIATVVGIQILFAVAYVLYKRRKANSPKKFL
jgi:mannose-binding lectin 1